MGDAVLSTFLDILLQKLVSNILEEFRLICGVDEELQKLAKTVSIIQAVIKNAEERQTSDAAVNIWLNELRTIAYDANDVIDEFTTEALRSAAVMEAGKNRKQQVRNIFSSCFNSNPVVFRRDIAHRIKKIREVLDEIANRWNALSIGVRIGENRFEAGDPLETSSLVDESCVFGRESDKQKIIDMLICTEYGGKDVCVIPIVGMGGLGKTTLAQVVYNDKRVEKLFDLKVWIQVSQDFNVRRLIKRIIESIVGYECDLLELDLMQRRLQEKLSGRRYLLVLDDVWNENYKEWEKLRVCLRVGAKGSGVLITSRSEMVARVMGTIPAYGLGILSDGACWSVFGQYAFDNRSPHSYPKLVAIGKEIVKKCKGLPLAAQTLGSLLRFETDENKWDSILKNEIWELPGEKNDILQNIKLSYQYLPAHLKQCFRYCSIFPKSYNFEKELLVQLWMAQDFIQPRGRERIEDIGGEYFDYLLRRSFFQYSHFDEKSDRSMYAMHDIIHDFAQSISREECFRTEYGKPCNIPRHARHLSVLFDNLEPVAVTNLSTSDQSKTKSEHDVFKLFYKAKDLYTLLLVATSKLWITHVPKALAKNLSCLRTLDLSNTNLCELPNSVGKLIHLRYLGLSNTNIERLPESTSSLYNLQTLGLRYCYGLKELPKGMKNLTKLRHLDMHLDDESDFISMPPEIGKLTCLQTLSKFVVGIQPGCRIGELKDLMDLRGELRIFDLHNVFTAEESKEANLKNKQQLRVLELRWGSDRTLKTRDGSNEQLKEDVLESLQPPNSLKELRIEGYGGINFPSWMGGSSLSNLVTAKLSFCGKCKLLPPFGQLPLLRDLTIKEMDGVEHVDGEFCGSGEVRGFPSLEKLQFESMANLEAWTGLEEDQFPSLRELVILDCPELHRLPDFLFTLKELTLWWCPRLMALPRMPTLHSLNLKDCSDMICDSLPQLTSLSSVILNSFPTMSTMPLVLGDIASLQQIEISFFPELVSLPEGGFPTALTYLGIKRCPMLLCLPEGLEKLDSLELLEIRDCNRLASLPEGMRNLRSLRRLEIAGCPLLSSLPRDGLPPSLQFFRIDECPLLKERCRSDGGEDWKKISGILSVWIEEEQIPTEGSLMESKIGSRQQSHPGEISKS